MVAGGRQQAALDWVQLCIGLGPRCQSTRVLTALADVFIACAAAVLVKYCCQSIRQLLSVHSRQASTLCKVDLYGVGIGEGF